MAVKAVWAIEAGMYSDYRVVGLYSTKTRAMKIAAMLGLTKDNVVLRRVDEEAWCFGARQALTWYALQIDEHGEIVDHWSREYLTPARTDAVRGNWRLERHQGKIVLRAELWAKSRKHAEKIVADRRRALMASGAWSLNGSQHERDVT